MLYSLLGAVQGMSHTYLSSVLTTVEKQFGIKSQEAAWIFSGNEISQIAFILVLPFLRRLNKRILWTSLALMVSSLGIFLCALPYFLKVRRIALLWLARPYCLYWAGQSSVRGRLDHSLPDRPGPVLEGGGGGGGD